jgi:hypothetical protein
MLLSINNKKRITSYYIQSLSPWRSATFYFGNTNGRVSVVNFCATGSYYMNAILIKHVTRPNATLKVARWCTQATVESCYGCFIIYWLWTSLQLQTPVLGTREINTCTKMITAPSFLNADVWSVTHSGYIILAGGSNDTHYKRWDRWAP